MSFKIIYRNLLIINALVLFPFYDCFSAERIDLTLDTAVDIALSNSYRIKKLTLDIERYTLERKASRAGLKTQIYMNVKSPDLVNISEYKWNSDLRRDELIRTNSQLWETELSIRQPLILFNYPTNGNLSLNYKMNRYLQKNGLQEIDYYNRLYLKFEQPFFLPNTMKNDLEEAELNLRDIKLSYLTSRMDIMDDISDDYYRLFEYTFEISLYEKHIDILKNLYEIAKQIVNDNGQRNIELDQIQLEISNSEESLLEIKSRLRRAKADFKQKLRLDPQDSLDIRIEIKFNPIPTELAEVIRIGMDNNPEILRRYIQKRRAEIYVEDEKGRNSFRVKLEMTYGLEKKNHQLYNLWEQFDNSNSITLNAYVPIWDGGGRKLRIQADQLNLKKRELDIVEQHEKTRMDIINSYTNVNEYYTRVLNMERSKELAAEILNVSVNNYAKNEISLQDLLQITSKHFQTEDNYVDVYMAYKKSLLDLQDKTYYDFEKNISLLEEEIEPIE